MYNTFFPLLLAIVKYFNPFCVPKNAKKLFPYKSRDLANAFISHLALWTMILPPKGITTLFQHIL